MAKLLAGMMALALAATAGAETFTVDTAHAEIGFSVTHLTLSKVKGQFNAFEGTIDYDIAAKTLNSVEGSIQAASIDTNNGKRDEHLKGDEFFNIEKFPKITFKSTSVEKTGDNTYTVKGKLNILGVDRNVELPVTVTGPVNDPWGNKRIGVECNTTLNRRDLGITSSPAVMIGDEVGISLSAEATYK